MTLKEAKSCIMHSNIFIDLRTIHFRDQSRYECENSNFFIEHGRISNGGGLMKEEVISFAVFHDDEKKPFLKISDVRKFVFDEVAKFDELIIEAICSPEQVASNKMALEKLRECQEAWKVFSEKCQHFSENGHQSLSRINN